MKYSCLVTHTQNSEQILQEACVLQLKGSTLQVYKKNWNPLNALFKSPLVQVEVSSKSISSSEDSLILSDENGDSEFKFELRDTSMLQELVASISTVLESKQRPGKLRKHKPQPLEQSRSINIQTDQLPKLVFFSISFIEKVGLDSQGLYRVSGSVSEIQRIFKDFQDGQSLNFKNNRESSTFNLPSVHSVAGVLKKYLRDAKLIPKELYINFIETVDFPSKHKRLFHLQQVLQQLPFTNYITLCYLTRHLLLVSSHTLNQMSVRNLAIVFGPTVFDALLLEDVSKQCQVMELLIEFTDFLFIRQATTLE